MGHMNSTVALVLLAIALSGPLRDYPLWWYLLAVLGWGLLAREGLAAKSGVARRHVLVGWVLVAVGVGLDAPLVRDLLVDTQFLWLRWLALVAFGVGILVFFSASPDRNGT
jgi:hypothetical protein